MAAKNFNSASSNRRRDRFFGPPTSPAQREAFFQAIVTNDLEQAETLLRKGVNPNARDSEGNTAFHHAIRSDNPAAFDLLAFYGADPNAQNRDHFTPFLEAIWQGRPRNMLERLIKVGADPSAGAMDRKNALHIAVKKNAADLIPFLVKEGVDINGRDEDGQTPLHYALVPVRPEIVKLLLQHGADPAVTDKRGESALYKAVEHADFATITEIAQHPRATGIISAAQTFDGMSTPLIAAVRRNQKETVELLLNLGALPNQPDSNKRTPLHHAFERGFEEMAKLLIKAGADPVKCGPDSVHRKNLIHLAVKEEKPALFSLLMRFGTNLHARDNENSNAIHYAVTKPSLENLARLLDAGVDPNVPDHWGRRPIDILSHYSGKDYTAAAQMLLAKGANPSMSPDSQQNGSPLHVTIRQNNLEMLEVLLKAGAKTEDRDRMDNATPLIDAARFSRPEIIDQLVKAGADLHARDKDGNTPLHIAAFSGNEPSVRALLAAGAGLEQQDNKSQTPLILALSRGYVPPAKLLMDAGSNINAKDEDQGNIFHAAARDNDNTRILQDLIKAAPHIDMNAQDKNGETPLMRAVRLSREHMACAFLEHNARTDIANNAGDTPLSLAIALTQTSVVVDILKKNPGEAARRLPNGKMPLHVAAENYSTNLASMLIDAGAKINTECTRTKNTALHSAVARNQRAMVEFLLDRGADIKAKNAQGEIAMDIANKIGNPAIIDLLTKAQERLDRTPGGGKPPHPGKGRPPRNGNII